MVRVPCVRYREAQKSTPVNSSTVKREKGEVEN